MPVDNKPLIACEEQRKGRCKEKNPKKLKGLRRVTHASLTRGQYYHSVSQVESVQH